MIGIRWFEDTLDLIIGDITGGFYNEILATELSTSSLMRCEIDCLV